MTEKELYNIRPQRNPMRTPEGYFGSFTDRLMQRVQQQSTLEQPALPASPSKFRITVRRFMRYAAAVAVAAVCIGTSTYIYTHQPVPTQDSLVTSPQSIALATSDDYSDEYIDEALDYEYINNSELAYYLTEAY